VLLLSKSVALTVEVEVAPFVIGLLFPLTDIDALGMEAVVKLLVTPPGVVQLEVVPVSAKLVSVPFSAFPELSFSVVTVFVKALAPWLK
jgi:hypothetical protein